ncbi:MAG: 6-pyruvoyl tetrahydropterin synthase family protein [Methanobacteriota archaeon]|nr:MAG: 6-pyruvoyl tetrahydropterin synthase family protein [Euryarchaeota archaeon]
MRLEINGWSSKITFSATHIIPGHYKCGRLHGHDYAINATIFGTIGADGVIMDFISVKEFLRKIAAELDHKVLIPLRDEGVKKDGDSIRYSLRGKEYLFPLEDCALLDVAVASAEELADFVLGRVKEKVHFPDNVSRVEIGVDEGEGQGAWTGIDLKA